MTFTGVPQLKLVNETITSMSCDIKESHKGLGNSGNVLFGTQMFL